MSRFLKLTNLIININHIHSIIKQSNKYHINVINSKITGNLFSLAGSGYGFINSENTNIEICETKHPIDYKILSDWIDKL